MCYETAIRSFLRLFEIVNGKFKCQESTRCQIPNVIGALDGTLVKIRKPVDQAIDFFCRKQYYAVSTQLCVGANLEIFFMATGFPGSMHDSTQFRSTALCRGLENSTLLQVPFACLPDGTVFRPLLLGDGAYRLSSYLLKPYSGALNDSKRYYNAKSKIAMATSVKNAGV